MRSLVWERVALDVGLEHLLLDERSADGHIIAVDDAGAPFRLSDRVTWDDRRRTRLVTARATIGPEERALDLASDGEGRWTADGAAAPELDGCIDVDLWPTPFTNSLPIWRLALAAGERRDLRVAWIEAPPHTVVASAQTYTRLAERCYLFENADGFRAELEVDEDGLVVNYPGLFRRRPARGA